MKEEKNKELARRLRHLVSFNDHEHGGPYGEYDATACMEAMREAADMLDPPQAPAPPDPRQLGLDL